VSADMKRTITLYTGFAEEQPLTLRIPQ